MYYDGACTCICNTHVRIYMHTAYTSLPNLKNQSVIITYESSCSQNLYNGNLKYILVNFTFTGGLCGCDAITRNNAKQDKSVLSFSFPSLFNSNNSSCKAKALTFYFRFRKKVVHEIKMLNLMLC